MIFSSTTPVETRTACYCGRHWLDQRDGHQRQRWSAIASSESTASTKILDGCRRSESSPLSRMFHKYKNISCETVGGIKKGYVPRYFSILDDF